MNLITAEKFSSNQCPTLHPASRFPVDQPGEESNRSVDRPSVPSPDVRRTHLGYDVDACWFEQMATRCASATVEELETTVALYPGALLNGVAPDHASEFVLWLTMTRERFSQLYLQMLTSLVERRQSAGDWRNVILLARRGLQQDPLQEHCYQALIAGQQQAFWPREWALGN